MAKGPAALPRGRRRPRMLLLIGVVVFTAIGSYVATGLLRRSAPLPPVQTIAVELGVAVAESNDTRFLHRDVREHRFVTPDTPDAEPAFHVYTDAQNRTIGFSAMLRTEAGDAATRPSHQRQLVTEFLRRYVGDPQIPAFEPAPERTPVTPPQALAHSWRSVAWGMHVWVQDYGEYAGGEIPAPLKATRRFIIVTAPNWEIPADVSVR